MEKITLEQFRHIKSLLFPYTSQEEKLIYKKQIDILFSYDLSEIPFEEWTGVYLNFSHKDLSNSKPNLDFLLLHPESYFNDINFKGCCLKNLDSRENRCTIDFLHKDNFDEEQRKDFEGLQNVFKDDVVYESAISGNLEIHEYRKYKDSITENQLRFWIRNNENMKKLEKIFGTTENYFSLVDAHLDMLDIFNDSIDSAYGFIHSEEELKEYIKTTIIYENLNNLTLNVIKALNKYLSLEEMLHLERIHQNQYTFLNKCGLDNLIELNEKYNGFFDELHYTVFGNYRFILNDFVDKSADLFLNFEIESKICNKDIIEKYNYFKNKKQLDTSDEVYEYLNLILSLSKYSITLEVFLDRYYRKVFPKQFITKEEIEDKVGKDVLEKQDINTLTKSFRKKSRFMTLFRYARKYPSLLELFEEKELAIPVGYKAYYNHLNKTNFYKVMALYSPFIHYSLNLGEDRIEYLFTKNNNDAETSLNAIMMEAIKKERILVHTNIYDFPEKFKEEHPELFLKNTYPFSNKYYTQQIDAEFLYNQTEIESYVTAFKNTDISVMFSRSNSNCTLEEDKNIYEVLGIHFSNEEIIRLMYMYGPLFDLLSTSNKLSTSFSKEEMLSVFYTKSRDFLLNRSMAVWMFPRDEEFRKRNPDLYLDKDAPASLKGLYKNRNLEISDFYYNKGMDFPKYLKDITTECFDSEKDTTFVNKLIEVGIPKEKIYQLFEVYGYIIENSFVFPKIEGVLESLLLEKGSKNVDPISILEETICRAMYSAFEEKNLSILPEAEEFQLFRKRYPTLFISDEADTAFKRKCYEANLSFNWLCYHKEQIPYLKGKDFKLFFNDSTERELISKYKEKKILGMLQKNADAMVQMIRNNQMDTAVEWYDKYHFIPHPVVMLNLDIHDADKFVANGKKWSKLMHYAKDFTKNNDDFVDALFKASCIFGVFNGDDKGYNEILDLFFVPKRLNQEQLKELEIEFLYEFNYLSEKIISLIKNVYDMESGKRDENFYNKLNLSDKKMVRAVLVKTGALLTEEKFHQTFGGMDTKYNPTFREFFLENLEYAKEEGYLSEFSKIERGFDKIVAFNRGRKMTFATALDYVSAVEYEDIEVGNEYLAILSSKSGYDEDDFDELQQIYHFTKLRTVNSIPRVEGEKGHFKYEILRLDDPLALVIGELTDCCQELNDAAKSSMIHSATDENGRVFVVRAKDNSIAAQSWVWRRDDTICFDNIEIPERLLKKENREMFAQEVLAVYQKAAHNLIKKENKTYQQLLKEGKISKKEFDSLKLSKVTVGLGYNDIKEMILKNLDKDTRPSRPYDYKSVIDGSTHLYLDSANQYILEENVDIKRKQKENFSYPVFAYQDEFCIYTKENMDQYKKELLENMLEDSVSTYYYDDIFEAIGDTYEIDNDRLKIVINYNFAFILEELENGVIIHDAFFAKEELSVTEEETIFEQMSYAYDTLESTYKNIECKVEEEKVKHFLENLNSHGKNR